MKSVRMLAAVAGLLLLAGASGQATTKPIVKVKSAKYKTVLSLDGDPFRAMVGAVLLTAVEQSIKDVIVAKKLTNYTSADQFDILLSDYFDLIAGSSGGGFSASYLATNGAQFASLYSGSDKDAIVPGTAASLVAYWGYMAGVFRAVSWNSSYSYQVELGNQFSSFFQKAFQGITTHTYSAYNTAALWTWTDLANMNMLYNFVDPKAKKSGFVRSAATSEPDEFLPAADYDLWTVTRGTGAYVPVISPIQAKTTASTPAGSNQTLTIADGCLGTTFPGVVAVPHMVLYDRVNASDIALLSIGNTNFSPMLEHDDFVAHIWKYSNSWQGGFNTSCAGSVVPTVQMMQSLLGSAATGRFIRLDQRLENGTACGYGNATQCLSLKKAIVDSSLAESTTAAYFDLAESMWDMYNTTVYDWIGRYLV